MGRRLRHKVICYHLKSTRTSGRPLILASLRSARAFVPGFGGSSVLWFTERVDLVCLRRLSGRTTYRRYHESDSVYALLKSAVVNLGVGARKASL